jgi:methionine-rich copper-binding protein CopC
VSDVRSVAVRFGEPVVTGLISVRKAGGGVVRARLSGLAEGGERLREVFPGRLRPGRYTVRWVVLARDGEQQRGTFRFRVR